MFYFDSNGLVRGASRFKEEYRIDEISLAIYRIVFAIAYLTVGPGPYAWLGGVPKAFFDPPALSLASLFSSFPSETFFVLLETITCCSLACLAIGLMTSTATLTLLACTVVGNSFHYSLGKIDHGIMIECVLFAMLFAGWGASLSVDRLISRKRSLPPTQSSLWLLAIFVAFGFLTAGLPKAASWIDLDVSTSGFLAWLYNCYYNAGSDKLLAPLALRVRPLWLWEIADVCAVVFELGFLVALFRRKYFCWWLFWLVCFI